MHENIVIWAEESYLIIFDGCLITYSKPEVLSFRKWNSFLYLDLDMVIRSILYKADLDPDPDPDLQKKRIPDIQKKWALYQNSLHELKTQMLTNLSVLISNMTIVFLNSSPKRPKSRIFSSKFRHSYFFAKLIN